MLKFLTPIVIIAGSLAYVAYRAQQAAIQAVPTAEHKKRVLDDKCPQCGGNFEATGGKPLSGPYRCQKCAAFEWHEAEDRRRREALSA